MRTLWICDWVIERSCERQSRSISMNPASSCSSYFLFFKVNFSSFFFFFFFQIFLSDGRVDNIAVMALHGLGCSSSMIFRPSHLFFFFFFFFFFLFYFFFLLLLLLYFLLFFIYFLSFPLRMGDGQGDEIVDVHANGKASFF